MATKKQRSRRAKTFRHDYALVKYDEEGNEIEVSASELRGKSPDEREQPKAAAAKAPARGAPPPPSWERAIKWGGLMGLGLGLVYVVFLHQPVGVILAPAFIPLKYFSDRFTYRFYMKRQAAKASDAVPAAPGSRGRKR